MAGMSQSEYLLSEIRVAERLGAPLLTRDPRLAGASGHAGVVDVV